MKAQFCGKGSGTLEMIIAFAVLALVMTAVIVVVFGNQTLAEDVSMQTGAQERARAMLAAAQVRSLQNFNALTAVATTSDGLFDEGLGVEDIDTQTKRVTASVSWRSGGRALSMALTTLAYDVRDWQGACAAPSGDWSKPVVLAYADIASPAGASGLAVRGARAYITSDPGSAGVDDFYVVDAGAGAGALPVLGSFSTTYGLTDVAVSGADAFVAADSARYQLLAVDVSDPAHFSVSNIIGKLRVTQSGDSAVGNTLAYAGGLLYLGLTKSSGPEFYIIDPSNPAAPSVVGSFEVGAAVNQIIVQNGYAYLATASSSAVVELDVHNPAAPAPVAAHARPSAVLTGQSVALNQSADLMYTGMIGASANPKFFALATGSIAGAPVWVQNKPKGSGVYRMLLRSGLLFMTTADATDSLQILDVSHAGVAPPRFDTAPLKLAGASTAALGCSGNDMYVGLNNTRALEVIGPS